jgi:hypothetical protein
VNQELRIVQPTSEPDYPTRELLVAGTAGWTYVRVAVIGESETHWATITLSVEELDALIEALNVLREARTK